jgi:hypothetical protein
LRGGSKRTSDTTGNQRTAATDTDTDTTDTTFPQGKFV